METSPLYQKQNKTSVEFSSLLTRKGQITVPVEIRNTLGFMEGDRIAVILESNRRVYLQRSGSVVAQTAGALKSTKSPFSAQELREIAEQAVADAVMERVS